MDLYLGFIFNEVIPQAYGLLDRLPWAPDPPDKDVQVVSSDVLDIQIDKATPATIVSWPYKTLLNGGEVVNGIFEIPHTSARGFRAASLQWSSSDSKFWCALKGYDFSYDFLHHSQKNSNRLGLLRIVKEKVAGFQRIDRRRFVETTRSFRIEDRPNGLSVSVDCKARGSVGPFRSVGEGARQLMIPTVLFMTEFQRLDAIYRNMRTPGKTKPMVMLQLYHAHLNLFADFLNVLVAGYANPRLETFDPQQVELRLWSLKAIIADSRFYRELTNAGTEMTATVESLLDFVLALKDYTDPNLKANDATDNDATDNDATDDTWSYLVVLSAEIKGCIRDITTRLAEISDSLDHNVRLLNLSRDMNQSGNVKILTLLATVFLPLSLSAGVLSMQSRFRDLGALLYDFVGVAILLTAVAILLLVIIFIFSTVREFESRFWQYGWYKTFVRPYVVVAISAITLVFSVLLLTSFVVGMFRNLALGGRVLGFGVLTAVGGPVVIVLIILLLRRVFAFSRTVFDVMVDCINQQEKPDDPEGQPTEETGESN